MKKFFSSVFAWFKSGHAVADVRSAEGVVVALAPVVSSVVPQARPVVAAVMAAKDAAEPVVAAVAAVEAAVSKGA
jgi:hypothetical protein